MGYASEERRLERRVQAKLDRTGASSGSSSLALDEGKSPGGTGAGRPRDASSVESSILKHGRPFEVF